MTTLTDDGPLDCGGEAPPTADARAAYMPDVAVPPLRRLRAASLCASLALHLAVAAACIFWISQRSGMVQEESPAISIELALTTVVEQLSADEISDVVQGAAQAVTASEDPLELKAAEAEAQSLSKIDAAAQGVDAIQGSAPLEDAVGKEARVVSFGVTTSGGLSYAHIAKSSGNARNGSCSPRLRSAAPFPAPPAGASPSQLRFSVSFHFR